ncbi:MAG: hypothetical protein LBU83_07965 [Bacteroidales bacterium]|jgi:hypothetical protein|nr:hypothetical protein [Bacteroidales bacterium]
MRKILLLLLIVSANISFAQDFNDDEVREHYYQILLKKWQESRDYQESTSCVSCMGINEVYDTLINALRRYYNIDMNRLNRTYRLEHLVCMGKECEYELAAVRGLPNGEQIWILFSEKLKKIVSMHKDKIWPRPPQIISPRPPQIISVENMRNSEANRLYERSLKNRCLACHSDCQSLPWSLYLLRRENIDSATAVPMAIKAAEEYYGITATYFEMIPLAARLMGDNKEHWMIYIVPKYIYRNLQRQDTCDREITRRYNNGSLFFPRTNQSLDWYCPMPIRVIISKENGEILFIGRSFL